MKNKNTGAVPEVKSTVFLIALIIFAIATLFEKHLYLAMGEAAVILVLLLYAFIVRKKRRRALSEYIEAITYNAETAKNNTLSNFPLPIVVFRLSDSKIVWGNEMFFSVCGRGGLRTEASVDKLFTGFSPKWLAEGKTQYPGILEHNGRKYQICGSIVHSSAGTEGKDFMGIAYFTDVTDYENIRREYTLSRPIAAVITIDNFDELVKNQPERTKNDLRDEISDKLSQWGIDKNGIIIRTDRDRYLAVFEERYMDDIIKDKFSVLSDVHAVMSPSGIHASLSLGFGRDASDFSEALQFATVASEMALSRGGDQAVIKNRFKFDFYGGKSSENETRTKVKSRVMANALATLIQDASQVLVMGHRMGDMDSIGAAVAVCCIAHRYGIKAHIIADTEKNLAKPLIEMLKASPEYQDSFIDARRAMLMADGRTLLVVVDTNRPEQVEDLALLQSCNKLAVIDHHRTASTYIDTADLSYIEPSASSACELMAEMLEIVLDEPKLLHCEAAAIMAGIVLDTKSFSIRTNYRTFDAAAFLRRAGADTTEVKKLLQSGIDQAVEKYKVMQSVRLYRGIAVAVSESTQSRVVAAQSADELLNISGVEASVVIYTDGEGTVYMSARSIGEVNVQLIMEKLGGGGNRAAAAAQIKDAEPDEVERRLLAAIDEYIDS